MSLSLESESEIRVESACVWRQVVGSLPLILKLTPVRTGVYLTLSPKLENLCGLKWLPVQIN